MRAAVCLVLAAAYVLADKNGDRRTKPFVADAVGNMIPPPSSVPASVGSPVNLLTPDRYEFYTFDESGELVKRLMTLEEIQAIVAAGEDSDGLVTFANDNQPTIAFNFSQPPFTKVHSVVTNVQNVLKEQMEAHRNKPQMQPTLDTPDVSDSWSLILPSIFGNTGVDIVPDKPTNGFTPETVTLEHSITSDDSENSLSKEGVSQILSSTTAEDADKIIMESEKTSATTAVPSTTKIATSTSPSTTTKKVTTTQKPSTTTKASTTTMKPSTTKSTTSRPIVRTTIKPTHKPTTAKPVVTSTTNAVLTEKPIGEFERISTFIPVTTAKYITERTTKKPVVTHAPTTYASTTKISPSTTSIAPKPISTTSQPKLSTTTVKITTEAISHSSAKDPEVERVNVTTVTTQSVSPSTTVTSTEFISSEQAHSDFVNEMKDTDPIIPLFDVAQSISQIASDLGSNYQPIPTTSNLLDTGKESELESKENLDIEIPSGNDDNSNVTDKNDNKFIKISTIDPHPPKEENLQTQQENKDQEENITTTEIPEVKITESITTESIDLSTISLEGFDITTIDPILSGSMEDLLSQVVNEAPQTIVNSQEALDDDQASITVGPTTTEKNIETTTEYFETTSEVVTTVKNELSTTEKVIINKEKSTTTEKSIEVIQPVEKVNINSSPPENKLDVKENVNKKDIKKENKLDTKNKVDEKNNKNKDFIQISVSNNNISSTIDSSTETLNIVKEKTNAPSTTEKPATSTTEAPKKPVEVVTEKIVKTEATTVTPKIEMTTKHTTTTVVHDKVLQSNKNKINTADKPSNKQDSVPKVEEFKKKIQKVNIAEEELINERNNSWKLIPTVTPPKANENTKDKNKSDNPYNSDSNDNKNVILDYSTENQGLEVTTKDLGEDIAQFTELCNELAFRYWSVMVENIDKRRSFVLSPYSITSMLAMMFMGARGATSGEMNDILKLDDMVTFNPHFTLKNISDSIETTPESGLIVSAFIRELYSDRNKGKILTFYKERAQHFYNGHVEEINFKLISDIIRRRTNLLVKRYSWGKIPEYMKTNNIVMKPPLAAFSTNIYQTDCTGSSVEGRDGEMYFVVSPNIRQRRLVPVPAVVYKSGFLAGYDPALDATVAALGNTNSIVSTIFLMPGQQGNVVHSDDLEKLEQRLLEANPTKPIWNRVLRTLLPRVGLELQIPRFSHKSVFNVSSTLKQMGLKDLFDADHADLGGLNGPSKDLYLSDMVQMTSFVTCGEGIIADQHHIEEYPEAGGLARRRTYRWVNDWDEPRDYQRAFHDPHDVGEAMHLPLHLRPRQARLPNRSVQPARLKFDRPFLFFVRHNPSGMLLYVGRYNPRLLP